MLYVCTYTNIPMNTCTPIYIHTQHICVCVYVLARTRVEFNKTHIHTLTPTHPLSHSLSFPLSLSLSQIIVCVYMYIHIYFLNAYVCIYTYICTHTVGHDSSESRQKAGTTVVFGRFEPFSLNCTSKLMSPLFWLSVMATSLVGCADLHHGPRFSNPGQVKVSNRHDLEPSSDRAQKRARVRPCPIPNGSYEYTRRVQAST